MRDAAVVVLLVLGVALQLLGCAGVLTMRSTFARLHYVAPAGFGVAAVAAAIFVEESFSIIGDKALATAALVLLTGPVLVHVTARAARVHGRGDWRVGEDEKAERVGP